MTLVLLAIVIWGAAWWLNTRIAASDFGSTRLGRLAVPVIFGITVLVVWELVVRGLQVSPVILPPPSAIAVTFASAPPTPRPPKP